MEQIDFSICSILFGVQVAFDFLLIILRIDFNRQMIPARVPIRSIFIGIRKVLLPN